MRRRSRSSCPAACPPKSSTRSLRKLEAFIERHGEIRVLEVIKDFEGMDAGAFWARRSIQSKACSRFQPDRHRDQSGRASSLVCLLYTSDAADE